MCPHRHPGRPLGKFNQFQFVGIDSCQLQLIFEGRTNREDKFFGIEYLPDHVPVWIGGKKFVVPSLAFKLESRTSELVRGCPKFCKRSIA